VTPGFVDIHTHYDGQAAWDAHTAPSSWHGVTTAVMGNCGVGFAPCKPGDREKLVELMEGGKKADLNVIDYTNLEADRPYVAYDLPAGGKRLLQKVKAYDATVVSGQVTYRQGEATSALPGGMVKGQRAAA
jgi:N-acyl-D-aspartate/D-glutamate deacylase